MLQNVFLQSLYKGDVYNCYAGCRLEFPKTRTIIEDRFNENIMVI